MKTVLGLDTSNYTTSAAVLKNATIYQSKLLLPVKKGEKGLRQSEAVFHHINQLPQVIKTLQAHFTQTPPGLLGASDAPRREAGSYMPCFTVGLSAARVLSDVLKVPLYTFSHQQGHIAAALYSAEKLELLEQPFLAFHVSGGTTEALLVKPDREEICKTQVVAGTLDLNAGQAIDRTGVMLGLSFPCGKDLEQLALGCDEEIKVRPVLKVRIPQQLFHFRHIFFAYRLLLRGRFAGFSKIPAKHQFVLQQPAAHKLHPAAELLFAVLQHAVAPGAGDAAVPGRKPV